MRQILNTCSWTEYEWNKKKREKLLQQKLSNTRRYATENLNQNKRTIYLLGKQASLDLKTPCP